MRWVVPKDWQGETVFIIGGGPSVADVDLSRLRGHHVVVINNSYVTYPDADCLVFTDLRWWTLHRLNVQKTFKGEIITLSPAHKLHHKKVRVVDRQRSSGLSNDPTRMTCWHTTMTTALNLVALRGASRVGVLGLDGKDSNGRAWHHEPHPMKWGRNPKRYSFHGEALQEVVAPLAEMRVQVFNLNPNSTHRMFPFASLDDLLAQRVAA